MSDLYLLDTNGASDLFSGRSPAHARAALAAREGGGVIAISVVTKAELMFGFAQQPGATRLQRAYGEFLKQAEVLPWDERPAESYAQIRLDLKRREFVLDTMDLLVAAHAHSRRARLVTRDTDFRCVAGLVQLVDWTAY